MSLDQIINNCQKKGINCIAVADHGTAEGGLQMQKIAPFKVIVAEEILTPHGEIMGMFLKESIFSQKPNLLSIEQAMSQIKAQGGVVCIPHPFDSLRKSRLTEELESYISWIDVIEVFNARSPFSQDAEKAKIFAQKHGIIRGAGSDAHTPGEIGNAFVEMPDFNGRDDFLRALAQGKVFGHRTSPLVHVGSVWARIKKRI